MRNCQPLGRGDLSGIVQHEGVNPPQLVAAHGARRWSYFTDEATTKPRVVCKIPVELKQDRVCDSSSLSVTAAVNERLRGLHDKAASPRASVLASCTAGRRHPAL